MFDVLQDIVGRGLNKLYGLWDELGIDENGRKVNILILISDFNHWSGFENILMDPDPWIWKSELRIPRIREVKLLRIPQDSNMGPDPTWPFFGRWKIHCQYVDVA